MQVTIPDILPIRFYRYNQVPDWSTYFPNYTNTPPLTKWFPGKYPAKYYSDWLINKQISLQLWLDVEGTEDLVLYKLNSSGGYDAHATVTGTDITPTGWVSQKVNRYDYTPTATGVYYFESTTAGIRSVKFGVFSEAKHIQKLVQVSYYNSFNDFGTVFYDSTISVYTPTAYFAGITEIGSPENEISIFKTDRGNPQKRRATPVPTITLQITDIHSSDIQRVNNMFSCDNITVNGLTYQNEEGIEVESIEMSDLVNITIQLTQTNYIYSI
jgi:hypothetical protein